jgi:hypothetical protein
MGRSVVDTTFLPFSLLSSPSHSTSFSFSPSGSHSHSHSHSLPYSPPLSPSPYLTLSPSTLSSKFLSNNTFFSGHTTHENTESNTRENSAKNSPRKLTTTSQNRPKLFVQKPQVFSFNLKKDLSGRMTIKNKEREVGSSSGKSRKEREREEEEEDRDDRQMQGGEYYTITMIVILHCAYSV